MRRPLAAPASDTPAARAAIDAFLQSHWARPADGSGIRASGPGLEGAALDVAACAVCHPAQFADWRHSLHSRAMGPGVAGQLVTMVAADPASGESCTRCHAPLGRADPFAGKKRSHARTSRRDRFHHALRHTFSHPLHHTRRQATPPTACTSAA